MEVAGVSPHFRHPGGTLLFILADVDSGIDQVGVVTTAHLQGTTCVGLLEVVAVERILFVDYFNRHGGLDVLGVFGHAEGLDVRWIGQP
jgi:hypothetical protein